MAKKKFQEAHWRPVPALPFDLPQEEQLAELRIAVNVTRYNLAVAHDEFDRAWKHYEFVEQQQAPHTLRKKTVRKKVQPPPGFSKAEHRKRDLEVALKRRP